MKNEIINPNEKSKKLKNNIIPKNLMKNNSFLYENEKNDKSLKDISVSQIEEQKRSKSSELININFSEFDIYSEKNYFDELQIIEPYITPREVNSISKILSFKNNETKEDMNCIIKKEKEKVNENIKNNVYNKYNIPRIKYKKKFDNNVKKINKNSSISKLFKKNDNNLISKINFNRTKNKVINKNKSTYRYKKNINYIKNFNYIPIKSIKIKHQKYMTNNNSFCKKENEKEKEKKNVKEKENINNINISNSNIENSVSTNFNSENINKYSPNITFGNKHSPSLSNVKYRELPKEFVYIKKINKKNSNGSIINKSKKNSTSNIRDYNQFQIELNNIKINDSYDIKNIKSIKKINYDVDENDNDKERISYVGKYKTFAQIERKNENLNIIKKIINNNLKTPIYNSNSNRIKENEKKLFLNNSEDQNYNNLKTATFYELDK